MSGEGLMSRLTNAGAGGRCVAEIRVSMRAEVAALLTLPEYPLFRPRPDKDYQPGRRPPLLDCVRLHG